jgi:23S rRNA-/tRNA-specific pseudouridylate synthase
MKRYFIQNKKNSSEVLKKMIMKNLKLPEDKAVQLIVQGSVWDKNGKSRIKDPEKMIHDELLEIFYPDYPVVPFNQNDLKIVYEDEWILIADKPGGVNCCPSPFSDTDCLLAGIKYYLKSTGIDHDPSPVNRLDKPTQGLIFFGKSKKAESELNKLFHAHRIRKLYLALTDKFEGVKDRYLIKDTLEWQGESRQAISYIIFEGEHNNQFYFTVYPKTGRTHQIRKHFQKYLIPVSGDALYGNYHRNDTMHLYCYLYRFRHPFLKQIITVKSPDAQYNCRSLLIKSV